MSTKESEMEVAEFVVSKGNPEVAQCGFEHCDDVDTTSQQDQSDESLCPKSSLIDSENIKGQERSDISVMMEGDCKDRSFFCNSQGEGEIYKENGTLAPNRYYCEERTSNHSKKPEISSDQRRNYSNGSCYSDKDQENCSIYSDEHTYQKKRTHTKRISHLDTDYDYYTQDESPGLANESHVNTTKLHSTSPCFIQMSNVRVDDQEFYQQREYEYLNNSLNHNERISISPQRQETCVVREYVYEESGYVLEEESSRNIKRDPCHSYDYGYEFQNEKIYQEEVTANTMELLSEEQGSSYEPNDDRLYKQREPYTVDHDNYEDRNYGYLQNSNSTGNKTYFINKIPYKETFKNEDSIQREYGSFSEENNYLCEGKASIPGNEGSAVDLRILRPLRQPTSPNNIHSSFDRKPVTEPQKSDDLSLSENSTENVSPFKICKTKKHDVNLLNSSHFTPDQADYEENNNDPLEQPRLNESYEYSVCGAPDKESTNLWDVATNTDHATVENKGSQTVFTEMRNVAIQTDIESKVIPFALFENIQKEIVKHECPVCQRVYISKSSFDRHLKTHEKEKNNAITNVRFATEAKLQISKRAGKSKHLKTQKPIIIQVPRSVFQCYLCEKFFQNQREKDNHVCTFNPFPLTKCPECHIKFYTSGALNEHLGIIHKKENAYSCIFCNKSFSAGYNFHLHLDEHLSTQ